MTQPKNSKLTAEEFEALTDRERQLHIDELKYGKQVKFATYKRRTEEAKARRAAYDECNKDIEERIARWAARH